MELQQTSRPTISEYKSPVDFIRDMIAYRKKTEHAFSVLNESRALRKISPALVSLILKGQRNITLDRVDEFSRLLKLTAAEKYFFREWLERLENPGQTPLSLESHVHRSRKEVSTHILNDWVNVYVKDCFQLRDVQRDPSLIYDRLAGIASPKRIDKAIQFLLREGHLRRTPKNQIVVETNLTVTDPQISSQKIRQFHKGALMVAKEAIDLFSPKERFVNTLLIPIDERSYLRLTDLVQDFAEKLKDFAATVPDGTRLYQVVVNVSPTGGKRK